MLTYALPVVRWLCGDAARHAVAEAVLLKNVYELLQTVADGPSAIASYVSSAALDMTRTPCVTYAVSIRQDKHTHTSAYVSIRQR
jgi:hypothetical protein